jgi:hypothetical protein
MPIEILDISYDKVIKSNFFVAKTTYKQAIEKIVPLINRFEQQRYTLPKAYYEKLRRDIKTGCIMPPLTLSIIDKNNLSKLSRDESTNYINSNISDAFVLDGIQRLNVLKNIYDGEITFLDLERPLYFNMLICDSMDKLLYRMITLNNGQRPMSARHQIEILANNIYSFNDFSINIQTEKDRKIKRILGSFNKDEIIKGYIAFVSGSINIDNQKIIESKMDELISDKIIESNVTERNFEYSDVIDIISKFINDNEEIRTWFKNENNLIGFSVGIIKSYQYLAKSNTNLFSDFIKRYDNAFSSLELSKIKLGYSKRKAVQFVIENYVKLEKYTEFQLLDEISMNI